VIYLDSTKLDTFKRRVTQPYPLDPDLCRIASDSQVPNPNSKLRRNSSALNYVNADDSERYCCWLTLDESRLEQIEAGQSFLLPPEMSPFLFRLPHPIELHIAENGVTTVRDCQRFENVRGKLGTAKPAAPRSLIPNPYGLFDVVGNVAEITKYWEPPGIPPTGLALKDSRLESRPPRGMLTVLGSSYLSQDSFNKTDSYTVIEQSEVGFRLAISLIGYPEEGEPANTR